MSIRARLPFFIAWPVMAGAGAAGCLLAVREGGPAITALALALFVVFAVSALFFTIRLRLFRDRLYACLRRIREGDYTTGIRLNAWLKDDVSELTVLMNETVDRLAYYDDLRTDRVALHFRALETILRTVDMAVVLVDAEERTLRPNPFLQRAFETARDTFTFEELERLPENAQFMALVKAGVFSEQAVMDGPAQLKLFASKGALPVEMRVVPLKDRKDIVRVALVFIILLDQDDNGAAGKQPPGETA